MKHPLLLALALLALPAYASDDAAILKARGTRLFADDFNRDEAQPAKEEIGGGWTSNSAWRAKGHKQVDLDAGAMHVTKHAEADHGVALFHDVDFQDGAVALRFKLGEGDDLGVDFVDRGLKTVHAGHLCIARVTLKNITLTDTRTGVMDNAIRERRLKGDKSPDLAKLLKTKTAGFPLNLNASEWHHLLVVVEGETMRVTVDGKLIGSLKSAGIAHPTKRMITLAVNKSARVDDVEVWKLK